MSEIEVNCELISDTIDELSDAIITYSEKLGYHCKSCLGVNNSWEEKHSIIHAEMCRPNRIILTLSNMLGKEI